MEFSINITIDMLNEIFTRLKKKYNESTNGFTFTCSLIIDALVYFSELWPFSIITEFVKDLLKEKIEDGTEVTESVENTTIKTATVIIICQGVQMSVISLAMESDYRLIYVPVIVGSSVILAVIGLKYGISKLKYDVFKKYFEDTFMYKYLYLDN